MDHNTFFKIEGINNDESARIIDLTLKNLIEQTMTLLENLDNVNIFNIYDNKGFNCKIYSKLLTLLFFLIKN